jgi:hypothetical protein
VFLQGIGQQHRGPFGIIEALWACVERSCARNVPRFRGALRIVWRRALLIKFQKIRPPEEATRPQLRHSSARAAVEIIAAAAIVA